MKETVAAHASSNTRPDVDAVIVGAGFAGLYMLHRLREMGLTTRVYEAGSGVGGTWYWNRYPGARCDVESMQYSYQFSEELEQTWQWSERYAPQPEILAYANHVADRFDLWRDIAFDTRVSSTRFDGERRQWVVETDAGERVTATWCVMATGCLSSPNKPDIDGLRQFRGATYHTGEWPHEGVDFSGQRVGVIGTGSSAIQSIPIIAEQAAHLYVFQRTANYAVPAHNAPMDPEVERYFKANYPELRARAKQSRNGLLIPHDAPPTCAMEVAPEERERTYQERWDTGGLLFSGSFVDLLTNRAANDTAADFVRGKIRAIVRNPQVADLLSPRSVLACKRLCVDTGYYETFNRPNVTLVDVSQQPVEAVTPGGLKAAGQSFELDAIVFATGFDAMTGALNRIDIRGAGGQLLREAWAEGPRTYLGLMVAGFPNLFTITGPGSPSVLSNMLPSIEQHVDWIAACIAHVRAQGAGCIEPTREAQREWVERVNEIADQTLYPTCNSWYLGANIPGKPRVFMPYIGFAAYVQTCEQVVRDGYAGFVVGGH